MKYARAGGVALLLSSALAAGSAGAGEKLAPELPFVATTSKRPIHLEDLRGQVIVFCFFDNASS